MEDTLREITALHNEQHSLCLNPCFNGRYSQRDAEVKNFDKAAVLILVLMEDTLREHTL